jgi:hypothetical protein
MAVRRVFLAWTNPLFHDAVRLLLQHPEVELVGEELEMEGWIAELRKSQPDVVVMEHSPDADPRMEEALLSLPPGAKLIRFGLEDSRMQIYHRQERTVAEAEELLQLVLGSGLDSERING